MAKTPMGGVDGTLRFRILINSNFHNVRGACMPVIYAEDPVVLPLLSRMRLPRQVLIDIGIKVGGERANVAECEPPQVAGFETWRWGTRFFREHEELKESGWEACERDLVSGVRNAKLGIKLVVCATNINTGNPDPNKQPKNVRDRGPASRRLIHQNTRQIPFGFVPPDDPKDELWYYCLYLSTQHIGIEISRPTDEYEGYITDFSDRIIIAKPGDIPGTRRFQVPEEFADVPRPRASRK